MSVERCDSASLVSGDAQLASLEYARLRAEELIEVCDAKFAVFPYTQVPRCWRRLYTDAAIIKICVAQSAFVWREDEASCFTEKLWDAIKAADLAIIIAGAPGPNRKELIQELIVGSQRTLLAYKGSGTRPTKRRRLSANKKARLDSEIKDKAEEMPCHARAKIPIRDWVPTYEDFDRKDTFDTFNTPFIVRGFADNWPALHAYPDEGERAGQPDARGGRWADGDYLRELAGPGRVVPVEVGGKYTEAGWSQDIISWDDFLESSGWPASKQQEKPDTAEEAPRWHGKPLYLAQHTLLGQFPDLYKDMLLPDLIYSSPPPPPWMPDYRPPINSETGEEDVLVNVWIGPPSTDSPAHTDPYYNCYGGSLASCRY